MAGSINLANVAIGFDASKIQRGVDMSAAEMRKLGSIVKESVSPMDRYNKEMDLLKRASDAGALSTRRMAEAQVHLKSKYLETSAAAKTGTDTLVAMASRYAGVAAAGMAVKKSVGFAAEMETNKAAFEVLTGSLGKAEAMLQSFVELDRQSPLSKGEFARAGKTLMGFGVDTELVSSRLKTLSEISMGNSERFQSLSLAFGQVTASGRLMGQEVLQMVNAGFNPLQQISKDTGRSMGDLKAAMERGEISTRMVADAFDHATEKGGLFYGMNEKILGTAAGQYAKLTSSIEQAATQIGTNLLPAAKALMDLLNSDTGAGGFLNRFSQTFGAGAEGIAATIASATLSKVSSVHS
jgi:tape measure domain-containing protein